MLKVSNIETWGFGHALRGMRNPMNSWVKSDSYEGCHGITCEECGQLYEGHCSSPDFNIGENDLKLARTLIKAGPEHRKFTRQIFISMDIEAPLYFWKEFDTYKVGTVANSCSTMHKIHAKEFELKDFSHEHLVDGWLKDLKNTIKVLNYAREHYLETKKKEYWWQMIQLLPSSYNQKRTVTMSYENAYIIEHQRGNHKLDEWHTLVDVINELPNYKELFKEG